MDYRIKQILGCTHENLQDHTVIKVKITTELGETKWFNIDAEELYLIMQVLGNIDE